MPEIPVDPASLPTSYEIMDETLTYEGFVREASTGEDKNGDAYLALKVEVTSPEMWIGKRVNDNYIPLPKAVSPTAGVGARRAEQDRRVKFGRFCAAFKPPVPLHTDTMSGATGKFTIRNEDYMGEPRPRIGSYVI